MMKLIVLIGNSARVNKFGYLLGLCILFSILLLDWIYPITLSRQSQYFAKVIASEQGEPLRSFADEEGIWRYPITLSDVSPLYLKALIQYEDRWFWFHPGVNLLSMLRAGVQNISHNRIVSGGSTITMQVARLIAPHKKTLLGKLKQIFRAFQLELQYSKSEILTYYLNNAPFGGTIEGVQAASYVYLGKSAVELSHAEAALLVVLPQAPSRNRPDRYPNKAADVRDKVLRRMLTNGVWSESIVNDALQEPVIALHFRQKIIAPLLTRRLKKITSKTSVVKTFIDKEMQLRVAGLVENHLNILPDKMSAAVLIVENKSLKIKAYVGSADFFSTKRFGHVDMVKAIRSPGSTLKPFLYGLAIDEGLIHSESLLNDVPSSFDGYTPKNFSRGFSGPVSVTNALTHSLNIPAVQVLQHLTPEHFVSRLKNTHLILQLRQYEKPNLSIVLGGVGSTLESLVGTYTALANKGIAGRVRLTKSSNIDKRYLMSEGAAWIIQNILSDQGNSSFAWKTGTSYGHRDFWSIGVTPTHTVGVWVGLPDGSSLPGHFGANTASPILFSIIEGLPKKSSFKKPQSVEMKDICWPLGGLVTETKSELCHEIKHAYILNNNVPVTLFGDGKNWTVNPLTIQINTDTGLTLNRRCTVKNSLDKKIALWPLSVEPWIARRYQRKSQIGQFDPSCQQQTINALNEIKILDLENNTILRAAGGAKKRPLVRLRSEGGQGAHFWYINGYLKHTVKQNQTVLHRFKIKGMYQITVVDEAGYSDSIEIEVR